MGYIAEFSFKILHYSDCIEFDISLFEILLLSVKMVLFPNDKNMIAEVLQVIWLQVVFVLKAFRTFLKRPLINTNSTLQALCNQAYTKKITGSEAKT